jgi:hypothetical protein
MKRAYPLILLVTFAVLQAAAQNSFVVTSTNATSNQLLVYGSSGQLMQTISTQGQGGASGNAGGIQAQGELLAVVNYGSQNVTVFRRTFSGYQFSQLVPAVSNPLSVAFANNHLYILGTTKVESHPMFATSLSSTADGISGLLLADGSAAQVGVLPGQLIITEKTGAIETVNLLATGAVSGLATSVMNIPPNPNAPFGLVTRGVDAYVTIAHSNEITLVRNDTVLTVTGSGTQNAPCWLALEGPFLFSSNSPSQSVSRYAVYGQTIIQEVAVAASFAGDPTDIAVSGSLLSVIDGSGTLSMFSVDQDGNLSLLHAIAVSTTANGVAIVSSGL